MTQSSRPFVSKEYWLDCALRFVWGRHLSPSPGSLAHRLACHYPSEFKAARDSAKNAFLTCYGRIWEELCEGRSPIEMLCAQVATYGPDASSPSVLALSSEVFAFGGAESRLALLNGYAQAVARWKDTERRAKDRDLRRESARNVVLGHWITQPLWALRLEDMPRALPDHSKEAIRKAIAFHKLKRFEIPYDRI